MSEWRDRRETHGPKLKARAEEYRNAAEQLRRTDGPDTDMWNMPVGEPRPGDFLQLKDGRLQWLRQENTVDGHGRMDMPGTEGFAGQDHTRRASQIAGQAIAEMMDRTTYLEGIVQARETEIADLMEAKLEVEANLSGVQHQASEDVEKVETEAGYLRRLVVEMEKTLKESEVVMILIRDSIAKNKKIGRQAKGVLKIPHALTWITTDRAQLAKFRRGGGLMVGYGEEK